MILLAGSLIFLVERHKWARESTSSSTSMNAGHKSESTSKLPPAFWLKERLCPDDGVISR